MEPDRDDVLVALKSRMLRDISGQKGSVIIWCDVPIEDCLRAARALCLRQHELEDEDTPANVGSALNPRNEAAALALLYAHQQDVCGGHADREAQLEALAAGYAQRTQQRAAAPPAPGLPFSEDSPEARLLRWVSGHGATSRLQPLSWGGLRGLAADQDVPGGTVVLELPEQLLISYSTARESDFGAALSRVPGIDEETLAVVWTMVDRHDAESPHARFWEALPARFDTGLSVPEPWLAPLEATPLWGRLRASRQHLQQQWEAVQPLLAGLLRAFGSQLRPEWFTQDAYMWAVELWYAYAIQVRFPGGHTQPALVPFVSLLNHSPWPHIVHFSTLDAATRRLPLRTLRPLAAGEQVALSYGAVPNEELLLFYGFCIPGGTPYDTYRLELDAASTPPPAPPPAADAAAAGDGAVVGGGDGSDSAAGGGDAGAAEGGAQGLQPAAARAPRVGGRAAAAAGGGDVAALRARALKRHRLPLLHELSVPPLQCGQQASRRGSRQDPAAAAPQRQWWREAPKGEALMATLRVLAASREHLRPLATGTCGPWRQVSASNERAAHALLQATLAPQRQRLQAALQQLAAAAAGGGGAELAGAAGFSQHAAEYCRGLLQLLGSYTADAAGGRASE